MWLVHSETKEQGWHICQASQVEPCLLLVFVPSSEKTWHAKYWMSNECKVRAKTHQEDLKDFAAMKDFPISSQPRYKDANWKTFVKEAWGTVLEYLGCRR